jgi:hypothetical protein
MMVAGLAAASLVLSGCVTGFAQWQKDQARTKDDFRHMQTEQQERDNYAACVNQGALPGSAENLECQLELARKEQQASKPQSTPAKQP